MRLILVIICFFSGEFNALWCSRTTEPVDSYVIFDSPSTCLCKPNQTDATDTVNELIQTEIDQALAKPETANFQGIRQQIEDQLIGPTSLRYPLYCGITIKLIQAISDEKIEGEHCKCPVEYWGITMHSVPSIKVGGHCIGTDKLGHFFEEGLIYYDIAQQKDERHAIAWGYWSEGIAPPDWDADIYNWLMTGEIKRNFCGRIMTTQNKRTWGQFGDQMTNGLRNVIFDPAGAASPADLAANHAGYRFFKDLATVDLSKGFKFDIKNYISKDWNQMTKPNIPGAARRKDYPAAP